MEPEARRVLTKPGHKNYMGQDNCKETDARLLGTRAAAWKVGWSPCQFHVHVQARLTRKMRSVLRI